VLICVEHQYVVHGLDQHIKRQHNLLAAKRRELLAVYTGLATDALEHVSLPATAGAPMAGLDEAQGAFPCCQEAVGEAGGVEQRGSSSCTAFNQQEMRKHTNQHHSVKLTRWSSPATASYKEYAAQR
jgi:hypothetical protein